MKRISPAKRNQLILAIVGTLAALGVVYFFLIYPQTEENQKLEAGISKSKSNLEQITKAIKQADANKKNAETISEELAQAETDLATGDLFIWTYDTFRQFKSSYHLDIPTIGQPVTAEVELIPNFPYKQIKFTLAGTGFYHDIGKFIADLENNFPHIRVVNLIMEPNYNAGAGQEKLSFRMEIMALVKPNS
jgi:Tfp pilus assembly protein PilO